MLSIICYLQGMRGIIALGAEMVYYGCILDSCIA